MIGINFANINIYKTLISIDVFGVKSHNESRALLK